MVTTHIFIGVFVYLGDLSFSVKGLTNTLLTTMPVQPYVSIINQYMSHTGSILILTNISFLVSGLIFHSRKNKKNGGPSLLIK